LINLKIRNFRVVKEADIEVKRGINILYGPNAGGKSTIIYALLATMGIGNENLKRKLALDGIIEVVHEGNYVRYVRLDKREGRYSCKAKDMERPYELKVDTIWEPYIEDIDEMQCYLKFWEEVGVRRVGYMFGDEVMVYNVGGRGSVSTLNVDRETVALRLKDIWDEQVWTQFTSKPHFYEELYESIRWLIGIRYLHGGYAFKDDKWIPAELLSYGERKTLALLLASKYSDLIVVEGFEGGFHIDLALDLMSQLEDKIVIVETHMGVVIGKGFERNWNIYYVENGIANRVSNLNDLLKTELIQKEAELYTWVVGG
jgi:energy-coupling factor transporter ATP-binding protein EcfA2